MTDDTAHAALERAREAYRRANPHHSDELDEAFAHQQGNDSDPEIVHAVGPQTSPHVTPSSGSEQLPLLEDPVAGWAAREVGMDRALNADRTVIWRFDADRWFNQLPVGSEVHADDLVRACGLPDAGVNRNNALGGWFSAKAKSGRLYDTGKRRKTTRTIGHVRKITVWRKIR
jgi:hypothetical protein